MAVQTVAGAVISISAATPATYDAAGYNALSFTAIGEITDGGSHGRTYNVVTHNPLATRATEKYKGSFNEGSKTLTVAIDQDDAGQILCKTALNDDDDYSFSVEYQDGSIDYFQAKVISFAKTTASVDSMVTASIGLEITTNGGVGIVEVSTSSAP